MAMARDKQAWAWTPVHGHGPQRSLEPARMPRRLAQETHTPQRAFYPCMPRMPTCLHLRARRCCALALTDQVITVRSAH